MPKPGIAITLMGLTAVLAIFCSASQAGESQELVEAARRDDLKQVQDLLDKGVDVNAKDNESMTALMAASEGGHEEVVKLLARNGAALNAKGPNGATAMEMARQKGHEKVIDFFEVRRTGYAAFKTLSGEVVSSAPRALGVRVHDSAEVKMIGLAPGTESSDLRRPAVGDTVEVRCQLKGRGQIGCVMTASKGKAEEVEWPSTAQETLPLKVLKGKVVLSLIRTLRIQVSGEGDTDPTTLRVGLRTGFTPVCRPSVGQEVEVTYRKQMELSLVTR